MPYRFTLPHYDPIILNRAHSPAQAVSMGVQALFNRNEFVQFHDFHNRERTRHYQRGEARVLTRAILNDGAERFTEELIEVPDLRGLTDAEASAALVNVGLELASDIIAEDLFADVVSRQEPQAGELVSKNTEVKIWLAMKKANVIEGLKVLSKRLRFFPERH